MTIAVVGILLVIVGIAVFNIIMGNKSKAEQIKFKLEMNRKLYKFLSKNFLTQKSMRTIYTKLSNLSVYKKEDLYDLSYKYLLLSWGISGALMVIGIILFEDAVSILICIAFAMVLKNTLIDKQLDAQYFKVLQAMSKALGSIRQEYLKSDSVVEAISEAEIDDILKKPFDEIYSILTLTNSDLRLQEFYATTPFRVLQTLVGVCVNINNQGDERDSDGNSAFIQALTILSTDINAEIMKIDTQKKKFGIIEYLPFVPIFAISFIESYFSGIMPGTAMIYSGPIGYLCRTLTILSCIVCYSIISKINTVVPIKEDDRVVWVLNALSNERIAEFIREVKPRGGKSRHLQLRLKLALSRQSIDELTLQSIAYAGIAFIATVLVIFSVLSMGSEYIETSTQQLSLVATDEMDSYSQESILELDNKYIAQRYALQPTYTLGQEISNVITDVVNLVTGKGFPDNSYVDLTDEAIAAMVSGYMPGLSDLQVLDQVKRLQDKFSIIVGTSFYWFYIWIAALIALWVSKVPSIQLKLRRNLVKTEAEDDFLQLQTLVSIFMSTDMDTIDTLYELSQHSRIHKDMLSYCYHSYPSNPELELTRLQSKTPLVEFKRFIGKLKLTISDLSMKEAFSDLIIEREQIMRLRETAIQTSIDKKRTLCGPISLTPLGFMVVGELLVPLGYLGYQEFMNALSMM